MRELVLCLHGLGEPHCYVDREETRYWWSAVSFVRLLDDVLELSANATTKIIITCDDGNASDALVALPELSRRGLTCSFFVCAGRIGKKHYLDQSMIRELLAGGMNIGSHGMHHRDWRTLDTAALDVEIGDARRKLEDITQRPVNTVAIPFGSYDRRLLYRLRRESWKCIYTSDGGTTQSNLKMKPRETLRADLQGKNVLSKLLARPSLRVRTGRTLWRLYKSLR